MALRKIRIMGDEYTYKGVQTGGADDSQNPDTGTGYAGHHV